MGNRTETEYDGNGNPTVARDALDNETVTAYNAVGRVTSVTYPDSTSETFEYDALGRELRRTERNGLVHTTTYDARGNTLTQGLEVDGDPDPVAYTLSTATYDLADRVATRTNADGLVVSYTYDGIGRVLAETYPDTTSRTTTYGPAGTLTRTDRLGHTTTNAYDAVGRLLSTTDPLSATTTYAYNAVGRLASITDALNRITTFAYDAEGRRTTTTHPDSTTDTVAYAAGGLVASTTDQTGIVTTFTYDAMGRTTATQVAGQTVSSTTYDALGRVATSTDGQAVTRTFTYDCMGRLLSTTMPDATADAATYGPNGVLTRTDRAAATTTYTYDESGRKASETNPNNETISYEYDLSGRMTALVDANSNRTEWTYDTEGRLVTKTYADASQYTYTYDAEGRLATRTDAKNQTTTYTRDARGSLLAVDYPDDTDIAYTYDALGRRASATDAAGTTTFTYSTAGQVASVDGPFADDTITLTHDASGRRLTTVLAGTTVATYACDAQGRLATVAGAPGTFTYSYAGNSGTVAAISRPGGIATAKTFDTLGRLTDVTHSRPGQAPAATIAGFAYTLDNHDRRTRIDFANGGRWDYTYDNAGQVTGGTRTGTTVGQTAGTLVTYGYQYDAMGNPLQRTEDAGVSTYTYNNLNQLATGDWTGTLSAFGWTRTDGLASLTVADGAQTVPATVLEPGEWTAKTLAANAGANTYTVTRTATDATTATAETSVVRPADQTAYTHDANGNMLANGGWTYTWNNENRLATATRADALQKLEFVYDFQGRRRLKRVYSRPTANDAFVLDKTVQFVYDGWLLLAEFTQQSEIANRKCVYLHGLDLSGTPEGAGGIGSMLAVTTTRSDSTVASSLFYLYDGNGNVAALVDPATTESAAAYEYSPFGKTLVAHGPLAATNPFRFSAKYTDTETGLVYYGYRYYEPALGRWINRDPISERGGVNLNSLLRNRPTCEMDAYGLKSVVYPKAWRLFWPRGWRCCCGGKRYNAATHCCCDGANLTLRAPVVTGMKICSARAQFWKNVQHMWLVTDDGSIDVVAGGTRYRDVFGSWGTVSDVQSGYYGTLGKAEVTCDDVLLWPCSVDLQTFRKELKSISDDYMHGLRRWWYKVPSHDCTEFVEDGLIGAAISKSRRNCTPGP